MALFATCVALVAIVPAAAMIVGGVRLARGASTEGRVAVEAVVVDYTNHTRARYVTFDYPVPGGWSRATRMEGISTIPRQGFLVHPGQRFTVWVDPLRPDDVALSADGSAKGLAGPALVVAGAIWGLFGAGMVAVVVDIGSRAG